MNIIPSINQINSLMDDMFAFCIVFKQPFINNTF